MLSQKMRLAWLVSIPAPCFFDQQAVHDKNSKGDICGFPNWDWKISKSHFLFLNIARRPHITQSDLVVLNLSRASCIFGHADIKWVTFTCAGGRFSISQSTTWSRAILKRKRTFFKPYVWTVTAMLHISPRSKQKILGFCIKKQSNHASKKWGALMKHSGKWLPFEQHLFVPKHLTLSQKMRLALWVSIPAPCFFAQQAVHDKNSKGVICGFPNWDWKISKQSLFLCEHCKKAPHHSKWPCVLNLSRASCMFGHVDIKWVTFMCAGGSSSEKSSLAWQSSCADTSPKWEVSTPCPKTKRTREVAILKREKGIFKFFPRQPVTCYSQCNRACCEHRLPETSRRTLDVPQRNRVTMQARSGSFDEAPWQMTPSRAAFVCSKASDIIAEDAFSVVSQHSSALFLRSAGSAWQELKERYSRISELRLQDLERVTFYFWTLQEDPTSHKVIFFSWTFLELPAYLVMLTSSELLSCVQGADSPYVNQQPEAGRMPCQKEQGML